MHVVYSLEPGGMEHGIVKLVNALDPAAVASSICSTTAAAGLAPLVRSGVPVFTLNRRSGNDPRLVVALARLMRRERPDVVHTHGWGTLLEGLIAARLAGVARVVHGEHGTLQLKWHQRHAQKWAWQRADQVLSVSSRLAEHAADAVGFPLSRIRTIRNGVDLSRFQQLRRPAARRQLDIDDQAFVIATAGRLVPVKDHSTLLSAVATLRTRGTQAVLLLAGDGPLRSALEGEASALGLREQIRFLGYRRDVETVFAAADVFVLSSRSEGLSNTIQEAMAARLPVVATRVGGTEELVQDGITGMLVPPAAPEVLAEALETLARDGVLRAQMGAAGRRRAETEFDLLAMVRAYEDVYHAVVGPTLPA